MFLTQKPGLTTFYHRGDVLSASYSIVDVMLAAYMIY